MNSNINRKRTYTQRPEHNHGNNEHMKNETRAEPKT